MSVNTQVLLVEQPKGKLEERHFEIRRDEIPSAGDGELLVRNVLLSLDAANRAWMQGPTYKDAVNPGDIMHGYALCEVVESRADGFAPGDIVEGEAGWQEYAVLKARRVQKSPDHRPLTHLLSVLGIAGKTAYHGLFNVAGIDAGETLLVSAAAGSVGSLVGQLGKIRGARVVGIAGGADKCRWVTDELGFDACLDYKAGNLGKALAEHCAEGVDVYFDNVGGEVLQAALFNMKAHGRIACCGAVSQYDTTTPSSPFGVPGLLVVKRLRMEGFIVMDFADRDATAVSELSDWITQGKLKVVEDVLEGVENAPRGLIGLLAGENRGKRMVRVGADPQ